MVTQLPSTSVLLSDARFVLETSSSSRAADDDDSSVELDDVSWPPKETSEHQFKLVECVDMAVVKKEVASSSVKEELRSKIQGRRLSEGVGELNVQFEPPKSYSLTVEEEKKYEKRKQKNRDSANRSRLKRKFQLQYLEKEEDQLNKKHDALVAEVDALSESKATMERLLSSHECKMACSSSTGNTSSTCVQSSSNGENSQEFNRGHAAFLKLSPARQMLFLQLYKQRCRIKPGTSTNS